MEIDLPDLCGYCQALEMDECPLLSAKQRDSETHTRLSAMIEAKQARTPSSEAVENLEQKQLMVDKTYSSELKWIRRTAAERDCPFIDEL